MGKNCPKKKSRRLAVPIVSTLLLFLGCLFYFSARWYLYLYGDMGFNSVLVTLMTGIEGVETKIWISFVCNALGTTLICTLPPALWCCHRSRFKLRLGLGGRKITLSPVRPGLYLSAAVLVFLLGSWRAIQLVGLPQWLDNVGSASPLISQEYVSPDDVEITFPEKKRNLIYIYLESMETTFFSQEQGGAMEECVIPELYELARDNISFSETEEPGGWGYVNSTTWTTAGMLAQSDGLPLLTPFTRNKGTYLHTSRPMAAVTTLWDILREQGYYQAVMMGSDKNFSGLVNLFTGHGVDRVYDWYSAMDDGIVPQGYEVWWGIEDAKLYDYARQELPKVAAQGKPFLFTLLTIDTHVPDGYTCPDCPDIYDDPCKNVYACASAKLAAFLQWLQTQPFYEDTTIVICGDHLTMDVAMMRRNNVDDACRRVYNCILGSAVPAENTGSRLFTPMDMFPTTLAALGCQIEGERLGLGTNLFSGVPTLAEEMGLGALNTELEHSILPYMLRFVLTPGQRQWLLSLFPDLVPQ